MVNAWRNRFTVPPTKAIATTPKIVGEARRFPASAPLTFHCVVARHRSRQVAAGITLVLGLTLGVVSMRGDLNVIEYLKKGVRSELTAMNQYWLHYRLLDNWGYKTLAKKWHEESIEEMQHADKLVMRIIFLDGMPNMQVLDPLHIGQTVKEVLDNDLQLEMAARVLYQEAATHCHSVKDYVSRDLFEKLMHDEEEHIDLLETQLDLVGKLGLELYAQHHIGKPEDD